MKQLTCEMCGGTNLIKQDGVFVCQNCGTKYSIEEAKKMMIEGTVDVQGTVKVDVSDKVKNLYIMARRAKDDNNAELASKYYEMITLENPHDWESLFYFNYFNADYTNLKNMPDLVIRLANSLDSVFDLIDKSDKTIDEKWNIAKEIITKIDTLCKFWIYRAKTHYEKFSHVEGAFLTVAGQTSAIAKLQKNMADLLEKYFAENSTQIVASYLKSYVDNYLLLDTLDKADVNIILECYSNKLIKAEEKIKALDPSYVPLINTNTQRNSASEQDSNNPVKTKDKWSKKKAGIICLFLMAVIVVIVIAFNKSTGNKNTIVGTWQGVVNPSVQVVCTDDGKYIAKDQTDNVIGTYSISGNKITINSDFDGLKIRDTYIFSIEGDKLTIGSLTYKRVK